MKIGEVFGSCCTRRLLDVGYRWITARIVVFTKEMILIVWLSFYILGGLHILPQVCYLKIDVIVTCAMSPLSALQGWIQIPSSLFPWIPSTLI